MVAFANNHFFKYKISYTRIIRLKLDYNIFNKTSLNYVVLIFFDGLKLKVSFVVKNAFSWQKH